VTDVAAAVTAACTASLKGLHVFNVGSGLGISVGALAALILEQMNLSLAIVESEEGKRPEGWEIPKLIADSSRARALLGWSPAVSLRRGIQHVIRPLESR
jgi:nucleoside-diphosphate-sugar epimerase